MGSKNVLRNLRRSGVMVVANTQAPYQPPAISSVNYDQGQIDGGGQSIVLAGTGFTGTTSVTFLGTSSSFTVNSDIQITATLPAHAAGTGNIQVTNPAGSATIAFEYWSPAQLTWTGWWRGSFTGSPFLDLSGNSRNWTEATNPPSVGAAVGGYTPADCDGTNDQMLAATSQTFFNDNSMSGSVLFYADSGAASSPGSRYSESGLVGSDDFADVGLTFSTGIGGGISIWRLNSVFSYGEVTIACATGGWNLAQWKYDGATLSMRLNGGVDSTTPMVSSALGGTNFRMGKAHNISANFDGKIMEMAFADTVISSANQTKFLKYCRQRYGLALT